MIANISTGSSFYNVALYNQKKVNTGDARILYTQRLRGTSPTHLNRAFELYNLSISKKVALHVSLSFAAEDAPKLNDEKMLDLTKAYMEKMGYGKQPFIVYRHMDTKHPHVHILTSRVDIETQKQINRSFDRVISKGITDKLEKAHGLTISDKQQVNQLAFIQPIKKVLLVERPENLQQFNEALIKHKIAARVEQTEKGLIYYRVGEEGQRNSKSYKASLYKGVDLDNSSLKNQFQKNIQTRQSLQAAIQQTLPKRGKIPSNLFSKRLQTQGIHTEFKVNPDNRITIHYNYKGHRYENSHLETSAQKQLLFPVPKDLRFREQLQQSIAANEPLELGYKNGKLVSKSVNPVIEQELNKRSDREILAISDIHHKYQEQYQRATTPKLRSAILALAATDIEDTLQDKMNQERLDQRKIRR